MGSIRLAIQSGLQAVNIRDFMGVARVGLFVKSVLQVRNLGDSVSVRGICLSVQSGLQTIDFGNLVRVRRDLPAAPEVGIFEFAVLIFPDDDERNRLDSVNVFVNYFRLPVGVRFDGLFHFVYRTAFSRVSVMFESVSGLVDERYRDGFRAVRRLIHYRAEPSSVGLDGKPHFVFYAHRSTSSISSSEGFRFPVLSAASPRAACRSAVLRSSSGNKSGSRKTWTVCLQFGCQICPVALNCATVG